MFIDVVGVLAIIFASLLGVTLVFAQVAKPQETPAQIERPEAKPTKNPTAPHHHYDRRHPHKGSRPNPQQKQN